MKDKLNLYSMKKKLKNVCKLIRGKHSPSKNDSSSWDDLNGKPWLRIVDLKDKVFHASKKISDKVINLTENHKKFLFKKNSTVIVVIGSSIGKVGWLMNDFYLSGNLYNIYTENKITNKYLYYFLLKNQKKINSLKYGTSQYQLAKSQLENFEINLPDFEKQKQIVKQLDEITKTTKKNLQQITEEKQKIIKIQKFLIEQKNRKNTTLCIWTKIKLKNISKLTRGRHSPEKDVTEHWDHLNGKSWLRVGDLKDRTYDTIKKLSNVGVKLIKNHNQFIFKKNSIALAVSGSIGKLGWLMDDFYASGDIWNISNQNKITSKFLYYSLLKNQKKINSLKYGTGQLHISKWQIENFEIDLPEFKIQKKITEQLDAITNTTKEYLFILNKEQKIILKIKKLMLQHKII